MQMNCEHNNCKNSLILTIPLALNQVLPTPRLLWDQQSKQNSWQQHWIQSHCDPSRHWSMQQRQMLLQLKKTMLKGNAPTEDHNQMHALWIAKRVSIEEGGLDVAVATAFHNCANSMINSSVLIPWSWSNRGAHRGNSMIVEQQRCAIPCNSTIVEQQMCTPIPQSW